MKKAAVFLVGKRRAFFGFFLLLAVISLFLAGQVRINYDLTEYLPDQSRMKQGMRLMEQEFGKEEASELRVMFTGLPEQEKEAVYQWLSGLEQVTAVDWAPGEAHNRGRYTLYEITAECGSHSKEAAALFRAVHEKYGSYGIDTDGSIHEANVPMLPMYMVILAVGLVLLILLIMCNSWLEPVLFLVQIGIAVIINLGTNIIFPSVSEYTFSIVGIMQLVLSMDYSIFLMNRYTQEKTRCPDNVSAMTEAISAAFPAITASSLTTFAGLLCLTLMGFRIGADMGFAMAKSVIVSLICIFTVLPSLILISDRWIVKTRKKALHIPMGSYSRCAVRGRMAYAAVFLVLFAGSFFLKNSVAIQYVLPANNPVDRVFEERNTLVLLYEAKDRDRIGEVMAPFETDEKITGITGYYNTIGKGYRPEELAGLFGDASAMADENMISMVFRLYAVEKGDPEMQTVTIPELISFVRNNVLQNPVFAGLINDEIRQQVEEADRMIAENASRLENGRFGRVILTTVCPEDSDETRALIRSLTERCQDILTGDSWLIGPSVMNAEMAQTFDAELNRITLISAAVIFLVVALTFRSLAVPLILVLTVQCSIYLTMAMIGLAGSGIFYLALLMVQCILMGATIDYAILYTSYYREHRLRGDLQEAIRSAYDGSLHTILTSALIMIAAAGILGFVFANPSIGEICLMISRGAISATLIIVFILPGVLAALDRFVCPKKG